MSERRLGVIAALARLLGVTEGQASTVVVGLVLGLGSAVVAIPPAVNGPRPAPAAAEAPLVPQAVGDAPPPAASQRQATPAPVPAPAPAPPVTPRPLQLPPPTSVTGPAPTSGAAAPPPPSQDRSTPAEPPVPPAGTVSTVASLDGVAAGVAVDDDGTTYVALNPVNGTAVAQLVVLDGAGARTASHPVEVDPQSSGLGGVALLDGAVVVVRGAPPSVLWLDAGTGRIARTVDVPDLPPCVTVLFDDACEPAPVDSPPTPTGVAIGADGQAYVTDATQGIIWRLGLEGDEAEPWLSSERFVSDAGPAGIEVDDAGDVVVSVTRSVFARTGGAVYRIAVDGEGAPAEPEELATTEPGSDPAELDLARSGRTYLALRGTGQVLVLDARGDEVERYLDDAPALREPFGLAFAGEALVVAGRDPQAEGRSLLLRIQVGEPGVDAAGSGRAVA